ncbi:MAG: hypothetical protein KGI98_17650, partial [Euryarchaeota archaeon]|nr:hypothetical protein [Euryarchaeota archaeon]
MDRMAHVGANDLITELRREAIDKDEEGGWTRTRVVSLPELRDPSLLSPYARAYMGEKALTVRDTRTRKVVGSDVSPGEVSRLYLRRIMAGDDLLSKRVPYRKDALQFSDRRPAYYFAGETAGPFVMVDVTACYATIYSRVSLDLTYRPECDPPLLGLGRGRFPRSSEWLGAKAERNALWGNLLRPRVREWQHGQPVERIPNRFFAPDLMGFVFDVAHAIAAEAVGMGAFSWAVDGGAFRP